MCIPPRSQTLQCATYRGVRLRSVLHTGESSSAVCIPPRSQAPRCASHRRIKWWKSLQHSMVCIPPRNQTLRCVSHRGVNNFSSVCFNPKFYEYYFSVMPEDINMKLFKESFLRQRFFRKNGVWKHKKLTFSIISLTLRCASYRGVNGTNFLKKLCSVHPTAESSSIVCFLLQSQAPWYAAHRGAGLGMGKHSFQKNALFLHSFAFFTKRMRCFLRSFTFFIKEHGALCVLLCSL